MNLHKLTFCKHLVLAVSTTALLASSALADEVSDVASLLRARQFAPALAQATAHLERKPGDPQMRFLKGLILAGLDRQDEAIAAFTKLTVDYPTLPEPYNNIAVLHAAAGRYDKARIALEDAVRANPGYARAHANLADLYAQLASQSYAMTLQLEPNNGPIRAKHQLIRSAIDHGGAALPLEVADARPDRPAPARAASPLSRAAATTPAANSANSANSASGAGADKEIKRDSVPAAGPDEVVAVVNAWAKAWSARDVAAYLDFYSLSFRTPNRQARARWEAARRARIEDKKFIDVSVLSPEVNIGKGTAKVQFLQNYASDTVSSSERKTLLLELQDGRWKILQEETH